MQHIASVAVSDATLLKAFVDRHEPLIDVGRGLDRGMWGVGFQRQGELLVRKAPIMANRPGVGAALDRVRARHVVLAADSRLTGADVANVQPLRYRDWLFAMCGTESLPSSYVGDVQRELSTFAFSTKRGATVAEATLMVFMDALYRANARDNRKLTTRAIWRALGRAVDRVKALAAGATLAASAILHVPGHAFALALGRPLYLARFRGLGPAPRARRMLQPHLKAIVVSDQPPDEHADIIAIDPVEGYGAVEIGEDCEPVTMSLDA